MFEILSQGLNNIFRLLKRKGRLSKKDIDETLRRIRIVLLEADVNFKVARDFIERVREKAQGKEVLEGLTPHQQLIKIIRDEMTLLLGGKRRDLTPCGSPPQMILLMGLQGCGKTTTCGKLAHHFKKNGYSPLLVPLDTKRPAAMEQLLALSGMVGAKMFHSKEVDDPLVLLEMAREMAMVESLKPILVDTAGRLHIDHELMEELKRLKDGIGDGKALLVLDAMTGQDGVNIAKAFNDEVGFDGVILTKLDGDARGGVALSLSMVTQSPIIWVGVGEKITDLEYFYPDRMASRIMGMGDILTLVEKVSREMKEDKKTKKELDLEDFLDEIKRVKRMGSIEQLLQMLPIPFDQKVVDIKGLDRIEAIINSMTPLERRNPEILNASRKRRIAIGSGTTLQDVNRLLRQFEETRLLMKKMKKGRFKLSF